ncbi:helix-turn-helix domain-containing protein [Nocardiopsis sp. NPDC006938]|uniref:helix-turn-helix domain-containing protein n=1 Tax=Nocardiopsis sp. NPDC006938 TaxID=3364337 RepID=UPI0036775130
MATIGQTLSAARIAAGCSLENLSTRTRIRMQVLRGIENEDFVPCGGDFYARGHIRRICKLFGIDPAPLLEEFEREHASPEKATFVPLPRHPSAQPKAARVAAAQGGRAHTGADEREAPQDVPRSIGDAEADPEQRAESWGHFERNQKLARPPRRNRPRGVPAGAGNGVPGPRRPGRHSRPQSPPPGPGPGAARAAAPRSGVSGTTSRRAEAFRRHWPWAVVGLILIAAVFVGVRTWQGWDEGNPVRTAFESARASGDEAVDSALRPEDAAVPVERAEPPVEVVPAEFTVTLSGTGRSWIEVKDAEGEGLFTGFLLEGESQEYAAEQPLNLWVGNAGAVDVAVDGEDHGPSGQIGEVREFTIGARGLGD